MIDKYGRDSPVVKVRCFGEFAEADEGQLLSLEWLELSRAAIFEEDGSLPHKRLSVDCADGGDNFTVLTLGEHYSSLIHLLKQQQFAFPGGRAPTMTADVVEKWWKRNNMSADNGDFIVVDALGVGAGVCSILVEKGYPVVRYIGGAVSDNTKLYRNRRVQSYMVCRNNFRDEFIIFDDNFVPEDEWDDLYAQACSIRRKEGGDRVEDLLTKKEMKDVGIRSPDRIDSIAMQFATQQPMIGAVTLNDVLMGSTLESVRYDIAR
jgi:hypothetical protein